MNLILKWFNEARTKSINATPADCMIANALYNVYRLRGLNCTQRNIILVKKSINDCILDKQDKQNLRQETSCPFNSGMGVFVQFFPLLERDEFQKFNPFCKIDSYEAYEKKIQIKDLEEAIKRF